MICQDFPVIVVDFVAVAVALFDFFFAIKTKGFRRFIEEAGTGTESECSADIFHTVLVREQCDHRMRRLWVQLNAVRFVQSGYISGIFYDRKLHAEADPEKRNLVHASEADRFDFTINAAVSKAAGNKDAIHVSKKTGGIFLCYLFGIDPVQIHNCTAGNSAMLQRFYNTDIGVVKLNVFTNQGNVYFACRCPQRFHHGFPVREIRCGTVQMKAFAGYLREVFFFHGKRRFV